MAGGVSALTAIQRSWRRPASLAAVLVVVSAAVARAAPTIAIDSAHFGNTFVAGEEPVLRVTVVGDPTTDLRGVLEVRARDAYGDPAGRVQVGVRLDAGATLRQDFPIRSARLGHFTVTATLRDAGDNIQAQAEATAGIVPPVDASDAEGSGVGYFVLPNDAELPLADDIAAQARRLGVRWVRMNFDWWLDARRTRPDLSRPEWLDSAAFERWVDAFQASGIEVMGVLFGAARWALWEPHAAGSRPDVGAWALVPAPGSPDWALFVRTLAGRLRGRVAAWEVWNEPGTQLCWAAPGEFYVDVVRSAAAELRVADPEARVVVNLLGDFESAYGREFLETVLAGAGDVLDVFGFHYGRRDVRRVASRLPPGMRFWNTENAGAPRRNVSRWLAERGRGIERIFTFIWHTSLDDADVYDFRRFGRYPVNLDYTPRFDAIAVRTLSDQVGSAQPVGTAPAGLGYVAYTFARPDGPVVALADDNEIGDTWSVGGGVWLWLSVPRGVRRVTAVDLMGNARTLRVRNGRLRLKLQGVAVFLRPELGESLTGLRVRRARRAGAR
jgi:hypothetical protein